MPKKATVKYRSLWSNLVHLPLSLYASLAQQQAVSRLPSRRRCIPLMGVATARPHPPSFTPHRVVL
jgi:peroxin-1